MSGLKAAIQQVTPFEQNCTVLWCEETGRAAIVDPGGDIDRIRETIEKYQVKPEKILLTHGHIDHAGGAAALSEALAIPIEGPAREDLFLLEALEEQGRQFGLTDARNVETGRWLEDGDTVKVGNLTLNVLHCPGHTPGHVVFVHPPSRLALVGDVLFKGSIGRTDFPRGDHETLLASIREKLWPLGDETAFISGHGPMSTFGEERRTNPFVGDLAR